MNHTNNNKQKKLLLALPLLVIPFATLFFWALGGGKTAQAQSGIAQLKGLNMKLPGAQLKNDSAENKLSFYEQAEKDSLKFMQARKDDPFYKADTSTSLQGKDSLYVYDTGIGPKEYESISSSNFSQHRLRNSRASLAADEQQINLKLSALNRQINQPYIPPQPIADNKEQAAATNLDAEPIHPQAATQKLGSADTADPQMQQLDHMMDKILDIEHPDLVRQRIKAQSEKERGAVLPVSNESNNGDETIMKGTADHPGNAVSYPDALEQNGFYDLDHTDEKQAGNAVTAVVHETQTLTAGATVKLRLLADIYIDGTLIPKDNFVFGTCSIEGERLNVDIKTIRYHNAVYPVSMRVFDADGLAGIYVPGAITRDAAKEGADQAVQSYDPLNYDPSLGAQAANAGIQVAKGLFSKKVRLIKVTVKAGYTVLLLNGNQLNQ